MDDNSGHATKPQRRRIMLAASACAVGGGALFLPRSSTTPRNPGPMARRCGSTAGLPEGKLKTVEWQGKTGMVLRRRPAEIEACSGRRGARRCRVPRIAATPVPKTPYAQRPEIFVAIGLLHPPGLYAGTQRRPFPLPCHTSKYDLAGRVFKVGPAQANLAISRLPASTATTR